MIFMKIGTLRILNFFTWVLLHWASAEQSLAPAHSLISEQEKPSPENPALQAQE